MIISKRIRNKAMRIIYDFHRERFIGKAITSDYLLHKGIPKSVDVRDVVSVLSAMGYLDLKQNWDEEVEYIYLTDQGRCYFETKSDERAAFWRRSILTPILVSIAVNLLIYGTEWLLPLILESASQVP